MELAEIVSSRRIVACLGPGGVGKTTVAAAIGVRAAQAGRRVLVLTIDPARRLASALGLDPRVPGPQRLPAERLAAAGCAGAASLEAEMLDPEWTLERLVARSSLDRATRARIRSNAVYQQFETSVGGGQTYMAMERLLELVEEEDHDLIVLDTPPSATAIGFLEAPQRVTQVMDNPILHVLAGGGGDGGGDSAASRLTRGLARFTGGEVFGVAGALLSDVRAVLRELGERAARIAAHLQGEESAMLVVLAPTAAAVREATFFRERLSAAGLPFAGFVVNGLQPGFGSPEAVDVGQAAEQLGKLPGLAEADAAARRTLAVGLRRCVADAAGLAAHERRLLEALPEPACARVTRLAGDVHSLAGLVEVGRQLYGEVDPASA